MGKKNGGPTVAEGKSDEVYYPSLNLDKVPKEVADKDIGHMCRLEVLGKIVSKSEGEHGENVVIEIHKLGYKGQGGKISREEYLAKDEEERDEYDEEQRENEEDEEKEEDD